MTIFDILSLLLGISLFLFGMSMMADTLKKNAGSTLVGFFKKMTSSRLKGLLFGMLLTAILQSSSATTVMIVGFVNAGTLTLSRSVPIIMGCNVGTAITSWITALSGINALGSLGSMLLWLKPSSFTPILAFIGLLFYITAKKDKKRNIGMIFLGFSILMVGMDIMSDSVAGLKENQAFQSILLAFENPVYGWLAGLVMTAVLQSSSAAIGILQSLTVTGAVTFGNAVPIIMGQNVGTCVTSLLASVGAEKNAKRASVVHLLFNVFGTVICLLLFYLIRIIWSPAILFGNIDMWGIATVHTLFNVITVIVLFPFAKYLEKIAFGGGRKVKSDGRFDVLDERLLEIPSIAIDGCKKLTVHMAQLSFDAVHRSCKSLVTEVDEREWNAVKSLEVEVDEYEDKIGNYLVQITHHTVLKEENFRINRLLHVLGNLERISDHARNLIESAEQKKKGRILFSDESGRELSVLFAAVHEISLLSFSVFKNENCELAKEIEPLEQVIDALHEEMKKRYVIRLQNHMETVEDGYILSDILTDLERIADHCSNIAELYLSTGDETVELHRSLQEYRSNSEEFDQRKRLFLEKYHL